MNLSLVLEENNILLKLSLIIKLFQTYKTLQSIYTLIDFIIDI